MKHQHSHLPLDADGLPILNSRISDEVLLAADDYPDELLEVRPTAEIAAELVSSELFQRQLDEVAAELTRSLRLQVEQALGTAIENVINEALNKNSVRSFELIRHHLEDSLPEILAKTLQDQGLSA